MAQSKICWQLNVQIKGGLSNLTYSSNNLKTYLVNWLKLSAYSATSSEGDNPSTHKRIIPIAQSKYIGDLTSKTRRSYQNPKYAQIWVIKIKPTSPELF